MKTIVTTVVFLLLLASAGYAQIAGPTIYDPVAGTINVQIHQDTSAIMYGCVAQYQGCTPQPYVHTGNLAFSMKNLRTGIVASDSHSGTGVFDINLNLNVQPGDVVQYSQTYEIHCPISLATVTLDTPIAYMKVAFTQVVPTSEKSTNGAFKHWNVAHKCSNVPAGAQPDFMPTDMYDTSTPYPTHWWVYGECFGATPFQPFVCQLAKQSKFITTPVNAVACDYTPHP